MSRSEREAHPTLSEWLVERILKLREGQIYFSNDGNSHVSPVLRVQICIGEYLRQPATRGRATKDVKASWRTLSLAASGRSAYRADIRSESLLDRLKTSESHETRFLLGDPVSRVFL